MHKRLSVLLAIVIIFSLGNIVYAESYGFFEGANSKLTRGTINALTGWVEIPAEIVRGCDRGLNPIGVLTGVLSGISRCIGRTVSGCADLSTFWAADPEDNIDVGIHMNNELAWEEAEEPYNIFEPNLVEGAAIPVFNKLIRGSTNLFCGIAEVPGQIRKGSQEDDIGLGIAKGLWYWFSREAWGIRDLLTLLLPTPSENVGAPFEEAQPWEAWSDTIQ